jgi:hypothetical protein
MVTSTEDGYWYDSLRPSFMGGCSRFVGGLDPLHSTAVVHLAGLPTQ